MSSSTSTPKSPKVAALVTLLDNYAAFAVSPDVSLKERRGTAGHWMAIDALGKLGFDRDETRQALEYLGYPKEKAR